jgi:hypothetical protein
VSKKTLLKRVLATVLVAVFLGYVWSIRGQLLTGFKSLDAASAAKLTALLILYWFFRAWRDRVLYQALGHRPHVAAIFWLITLQGSLNYLPLKAGTFSSATLFRSKLGVPYREFALVLAQQYLFTVCVSSFLAAAAMGFVPAGSSSGKAVIALCLAAIGAVCLLLLCWHGSVRLLPEAAARRLEGTARHFAVFHNAPREALWALALTVPMCVLGAMRMIVIYGVLVLHLALPSALVIAASMQLSAMLSVTPAGIGILESAVAISSVLVAHTAEDGVIAATIDRAVALAVGVTLALLLPAVRFFQPDSRRGS